MPIENENNVGKLALLNAKGKRRKSIMVKDAHMTFGSDPNCTIRILKPDIPDTFFRIDVDYENKTAFIEKVQETKRILLVNGKPLNLNEKVEIHDAELFGVDDGQFIFEFSSSSNRSSITALNECDVSEEESLKSNDIEPETNTCNKIEDSLDCVTPKNENKEKTATCVINEQLQQEDIVSARKSVSFGPHISPELFDKRLPPITPIRKGSTPFGLRKSSRSSLKKTPHVDILNSASGTWTSSKAVIDCDESFEFSGKKRRISEGLSCSDSKKKRREAGLHLPSPKLNLYLNDSVKQTVLDSSKEDSDNSLMLESTQIVERNPNSNDKSNDNVSSEISVENLKSQHEDENTVVNLGDIVNNDNVDEYELMKFSKKEREELRSKRRSSFTVKEKTIKTPSVNRVVAVRAIAGTGVHKPKIPSDSKRKSSLWSHVVTKNIKDLNFKTECAKKIYKKSYVKKGLSVIETKTPPAFRKLLGAAASTGHINSPETIYVRKEKILSSMEMQENCNDGLSNENTSGYSDIPPTPDPPSAVVSPIKSPLKSTSPSTSARLRTSEECEIKGSASPKLDETSSLSNIRCRLRSSSGSPKIKGIKELLKTPKLCEDICINGINQLLNDITEKSPVLTKIQQLFQNHKNEVVKSPQLIGLKDIFMTPKNKRKSLNICKTITPSGLKRVFKMPKQNKPIKLFGLKELFNDKKIQNSPVLIGIKELLLESQLKSTIDIDLNNKLTNCLHNSPRLSGLRELFHLSKQNVVSDEILESIPEFFDRNGPPIEMQKLDEENIEKCVHFSKEDKIYAITPHLKKRSVRIKEKCKKSEHKFESISEDNNKLAEHKLDSISEDNNKLVEEATSKISNCNLENETKCLNDMPFLNNSEQLDEKFNIENNNKSKSVEIFNLEDHNNIHNENNCVQLEEISSKRKRGRPKRKQSPMKTSNAILNNNENNSEKSKIRLTRRCKNIKLDHTSVNNDEVIEKQIELNEDDHFENLKDHQFKEVSKKGPIKKSGKVKPTSISSVLSETNIDEIREDKNIEVNSLSSQTKNVKRLRRKKTSNTEDYLMDSNEKTENINVESKPIKGKKRNDSKKCNVLDDEKNIDDNEFIAPVRITRGKKAILDAKKKIKKEDFENIIPAMEGDNDKILDSLTNNLRKHKSKKTKIEKQNEKLNIDRTDEILEKNKQVKENSANYKEVLDEEIQADFKDDVKKVKKRKVKESLKITQSQKLQSDADENEMLKSINKNIEENDEQLSNENNNASIFNIQKLEKKPSKRSNKSKVLSEIIDSPAKNTRRGRRKETLTNNTEKRVTRSTK